MLEQNRRIDPAAPVGDFSTVPMAEPAHDAQLAGMMSLDPVEVEPTPERYTGPSPVLVRQSSRQSWAQAKRLDVLKDMAPERLAVWVDGMNEVAGFAKYHRAPVDLVMQHTFAQPK